MKIPKKVQKKYDVLYPGLDRTSGDIEGLIRHSLRDLGDPHLIRHRLVEARVKELGELWAKGRRKGWKSDEVLNKAKDLIGARIVCANLEDIPRARDLVLQNPRFTLINGSEKNYIQFPTDDGYRGLHFTVNYEGTYENKVLSVQCEIQIRSMLQDSWATLAHRDIYKEGEGLPEDLTKLTRRLSDLLAVADDISQDIREQVSKPREVTKRPAGVTVSENGLAFVYYRAFKNHPSDHFVKFIIKRCIDLNVTRLDKFERELMNRKNHKVLKEVYEKQITWEMEEDRVFEWIPYVVAKGMDFAKKVVRREAKREWDEIEAFYRSELMSELPDTFDEFINRLEGSNKDDFIEAPGWVTRIGTLFKATDHCAMCGTVIVDAGAFTDGALEHYNVDENRDTFDHVYSLVLHSGAEVSDGILCDHCDLAMSKD